MKRIKILPDYDLEDPTQFDGSWTLYAFSNRMNHSADPESVGFEIGENGHYPSIGLRRKLAVGTAFMVSYFEHGNCKWGLAGSMDRMFGFWWGGVANAGLLVWEHPVSDMGAKTYQDRAKDASITLDLYTDYCNGNGYGYVIEDPAVDEDGFIESDDSCFGFYGSDAVGMADYIASAVAGHRWEIVDSECGSPYGLEREIEKMVASIQARVATFA